eukprot:scaffold134453_cov29-Attheya_sp.AAC.1
MDAEDTVTWNASGVLRLFWSSGKSGPNKHSCRHFGLLKDPLLSTAGTNDPLARKCTWGPYISV